MLEVILFWIGAGVVIVLGLLLLAFLIYLMAIVWIRASNKRWRILRTESLIYEYKNNRDEYLAWKETLDNGSE